MSLDDTRRFLDAVLRVIDEFERGSMDVARLQSALEGALQRSTTVRRTLSTS
jgi:hypothetical protein